MTIYTTYFAQLRNLPENIVPVSICGEAPNWYTGLEYKKLAPKYDFFIQWKKTHDNNYYIKCFKEQVLSQVTVSEVINKLSNMVGSEKDVALVCYENPPDFCHRHLVSGWLRENGVWCDEWKSE